MKQLSSTDQNSTPLTNVPEPVNPQDAANKAYADTKANTTHTHVSSDVTNLNTVIANAIAANNLNTYPVGTIYINKTNSANPNTYLPGMSGTTWVSIQDRFIMGAGPIYPGNSTGGSLTHSHGLSTGFANVAILGGALRTKRQQDTAGSTYVSSRAATVSDTADSTLTDWKSTLSGNTEEGNYLPPFQTAYAWERTA